MPLLHIVSFPQLLVLPGILIHLDLQVLVSTRTGLSPFPGSWHGPGLARPEGALTYLNQTQQGAGVGVVRWRPQRKSMGCRPASGEFMV